ncbi:MAG: leucine-rich repeat protein, partial [Bacteroidales bacterium]|nr:leucine-rich repeat protein [Bacteroidales bacterium]
MKTNLRFSLLALVCVLCSLVPIGVQAMDEASSESEYNYSVYLDNRKLPGDMMYVYIQETMGTGIPDIVSNAAMTLNADGLWEYSFTTSRDLMLPVVNFRSSMEGYSATYLYENGKTYVIDDICVDGIYYLENGIYFMPQVSVTYRGMSYYEHANEYSGEVVVPSHFTHEGVEYSVSAVGSSAFQDCVGLTDVTVSEGCYMIAQWAFAGCEGLKTVRLPSTIAEIVDNAFY